MKHVILSETGKHPLSTHSILTFTTLLLLSSSPLSKSRSLWHLKRGFRPWVLFRTHSDPAARRVSESTSLSASLVASISKYLL